MGRGLARRPPACAEHPHRAAVDHCDVCGRVYCRECLVRGGPQLMCAACWASAPQREAEAARRRRPFYRLRRAWQEERAEVVAGGAIVVTLALLAFSSLGGLINPRARAEMAIPVGQAARALSLPPPASGPTPIPTLLSSPASALGPEVESPTDLRPLVDGRTGEGAPVWRSAAGVASRLPIELRFSTGYTVLAGRVLFAHSNGAPPETWAKGVEVWLSPGGDFGEAVHAGRWTLEPTTSAQEFTFPRTAVRAVRLRLLTNFGAREQTSLAEFALLPPPRT